MLHPVLTVLFDVFLIGSAGAILAAMTLEAGASRRPAIGRARVRALGRREQRTARPNLLEARRQGAVGRHATRFRRHAA